ncbi:glycogen synthase GlgA [Opitutus terrae]|uniref:Glycogen synthase n=1 Tax=Opitutus terrae (strain DSM 11246 / JCM 15787 / PB90-1) TaxID=452637 RepID=GLGA_OPITP|nr:glycogen synthase GlgA [Opitutus terrae]B1ZUX5.1 RecName: Full=Glycogen synthase; AltName: Full=Starch [bacterial glycogen] synthase [Opitutus terrae PB90-1]ACB75945.1 glycogen/starch synthase, ADP-glucose type [Opitutus terrae PB90-1]
MKIVHVASELFPYVKTGGLADAVASLAGMLADSGHEVAVFLPGYRAALEHRDAAAAERRYRLKVEMGQQYLSGDVRVFSPRPNLSIFLICREEFFDRRAPYGNGERDYEDNSDRFIFFCKGVVETLRLADMQADVVHAHDWQAALLPLLLREAERRQGGMLAMKTIFTIHNIAFQGIFPRAVFARTNLPDELNSVDGLEYYEQINFMKAGILFADRVTTVSPRYAEEIQTPEFGCGLDGVVQTRESDLVGLLNGVDTKVWNPATDPLLPARYSRADLAGKRVCRAELLKRFGFAPDFDGPVFGMVCRLAEQKGVDLVLANQGFFLSQSCRLIVLGAGELRYETAMKALAARAPNKIALSAKLDEAMSHLIEAGSDFFLMPSLFEPCGLNQMYSQIYGTLPIVSRVGGLVDTVIDADQQPEKGTGLMCEPTSASLLDVLARAMTLFDDKPRYGTVQQRAMAREFGWNVAAAGYERLYRDTL